MKVSGGKLGSLIIGLAIITSSCVREGCMDTTAVNFDSKATKDDGSCTYLTSSDEQGSQEKGNHTYSLITTEGDTLFFGEIPYADGMAYAGIDEDNNRYRLRWMFSDEEEPGVLCGGVIYLNQNNQPEMSTITSNSNDGNGIQMQTLGINAVLAQTYEGIIALENFKVRNEIPTGDRRITTTVVFEGDFIDLAGEYFSGKLKITFNN